VILQRRRESRSRLFPLEKFVIVHPSGYIFVAFLNGNSIRSLFSCGILLSRWPASRKTLSRMRIPDCAGVFWARLAPDALPLSSAFRGSPTFITRDAKWRRLKSDDAAGPGSRSLTAVHVASIAHAIARSMQIIMWRLANKAKAEECSSPPMREHVEHAEWSKNISSARLLSTRQSDVVIAGAFGSAVPSEPRGLFKTTDGGIWTKRSRMLTALPE